MGPGSKARFLQARAFGFMETYIVAESEDGQWGHVHFTGPEGYEVGSVVDQGKMINSVVICGDMW